MTGSMMCICKKYVYEDIINFMFTESIQTSFTLI